MPPAPSLRVPARVASLFCAVVLAIAAAGPAALPAQALASPQQAANSRVVLDLPAGYQPAALFSGFQNDELGVSFVILEAPPKAYDEMATGFVGSELAKRGLTDAEKGSLARDGDYVYMRARQKSPAGSYAKFFVLFRTADQTVLISCNVPQAALDGGSVKPEDVEKVLATARTVEATAVKDIYRLGYLGPFREAGRVAGTSRIYTLDGRMDVEPQGDSPRAMVVVAPSLDQRTITDEAELARKLVLSLSGYRDIKPADPRKLSVGAAPAVEIVTEAVDVASGVPVRIYQMLICPAEGGYFRLIGIAAANDSPRLDPEFRRIAEAFQVRP